MSSYLLLKALHVTAAMVIVAGVAGLAAHAAAGGKKADNPASGTLTALHGLGLLMSLVGGFGMLYLAMRTPSMPSPAWAVAKLVLWVLFAALAAVPYRWPRAARWVLGVALPVLGLCAAVVAILKPF